MLRFLVTSSARRRLLELLWRENATGSASDLAKAAAVGFASAYRELKAMVMWDLVIVRHERGHDVYRANVEHPDADVMRRLVALRPGAQPPRDKQSYDVRQRLRTLGAPLMGIAGTYVPDVEAALIDGVALARRDAVLARTLPICFWRARQRIDGERLARLALDRGQRHATGFFLDLTAELGRDRRLRALSRGLRDRRVRTTQDFFQVPVSLVTRETAERATPLVARRWGYRINMDLGTFRTLFDEFADAR